MSKRTQAEHLAALTDWQTDASAHARLLADPIYGEIIAKLTDLGIDPLAWLLLPNARLPLMWPEGPHWRSVNYLVNSGRLQILALIDQLEKVAKNG